MNYPESIQPQLEILNKIEFYEERLEFNRFLLISAFSGLIAIFVGWMEYIFNRFVGIDISLFQFGFTTKGSLSPANEPILFFSIWFILFIVIVSIIVFSSGLSSFISWNRSYRIIGIYAIITYLICEGIIAILGLQFEKVIPLVWGIAISSGFVFTAEILYRKEKQYQLRVGMLSIGIMSFVLSIIAYFLIEPKLAMFFFLISLGIVLILSSAILYYLIGRIKSQPNL